MAQLFFLSSGGGGGGNVSGPGASTDNAVVRWDGITGTLIKDSTVLLSAAGVFTGTVATPDVGVQGLDVPLGSGGHVQLRGGEGSSALTDGAVEIRPNSADRVTELRFYETAANGGNYISLEAPDILGPSYSLVLPVMQGGLNTFLRNDGTGTLDWATPAGGGDVSGPGVSTDNALVTWYGVTGTSLNDNTPTLIGADFAGVDSIAANTDLDFVVGTGGVVSLSNSNAAQVAPLRFYEASANGADYIELQAPTALAAPTTYTLPDAFPAVDGYVLTSDTAGVMSWQPGSLAPTGPFVTAGPGTPYVVAATDTYILATASIIPIVITLPAPATVTHPIHIKKTDATANTVTISGATIDGIASVILSTQYDAVTLVSDGSVYWLF
jgi:hypothetical protein